MKNTNPLKANLFLTMLISVVLSGCASSGGSGDLAMTITITSTAFKSGDTIPKKYTGEDKDISPALNWSNVPKEAKEMALIVDDPDAPSPQPWVHWVIYNIAASVSALPEAVHPDETLKEPAGATQGKNDFGKIGYGGPMPPPGRGTHHYHFKLYALNAPLNLRPGATKKELLEAMKGKIIAQGELIGTFERKK
jgi:Raf kinase inhibitor-like YbhB/YbcL family protein